MSIRENFGQRLKMLRKHKGMSQDDISFASGVDRSYLSEIENGKSSPTIDMVDKIARALNIAPNEFFIFDVSEPKTDYDGEPLNTVKE
ncbi:MAG: helix-turn-helix domain-containing protein [bacterium]